MNKVKLDINNSYLVSKQGYLILKKEDNSRIIIYPKEYPKDNNHYFSIKVGNRYVTRAPGKLIWESFNGKLPTNTIVVRKNKNKGYELSNLKIVDKRTLSPIIVSKIKELIGSKYSLRKIAKVLNKNPRTIKKIKDGINYQDVK